MALFIVVRDNPYWTRGTYVEEVDASHVQAHQMIRCEDKAWRPMYPYGLVIPTKDVRDAIFKIQNRGGIDMRGLKG